MDEKHLSARLLEVARYIPQGSRLADIGSDHAYLPAYLALQGKIAFAVCGEVVAGPLHNAEHVIKTNNLQAQLQARLADGLAAVTAADKIDCVTICGMGGTLIAEILERGQALIAQTQPRLILQPNVSAENVRAWLVAHNYKITAEAILTEDHHTYEIIVADPMATPVKLTDDELLFGPLLVRQQNEAFATKWHQELDKLMTIKQALQRANVLPAQKMAAVDQKIAQIEGVLNDKQ